MIVVPPRPPTPDPALVVSGFRVRLVLLAPHVGELVHASLHIVPAAVHERRNAFRALPLPEALVAASSRPLPIVWAYLLARRARPRPPAHVLMYHCEGRVPIDWSAAGRAFTIHAQENDNVTRTVKALVNWLVETVAQSEHASFVPSVRFAGAREGYVFKAGPLGLGYYDERRRGVRRGSAADHTGGRKRGLALHLSPGSLTGYKGVRYDPRAGRKKPFNAQGMMAGRTISLGLFSSAFEAAMAYGRHVEATSAHAASASTGVLATAGLTEVSTLRESIRNAEAAGDCSQIELLRVRLGEVEAAQELLRASVLSGGCAELEEAIGVAESIFIDGKEIARAKARLAMRLAEVKTRK